MQGHLLKYHANAQFSSNSQLSNSPFRVYLIFFFSFFLFNFILLLSAVLFRRAGLVFISCMRNSCCSTSSTGGCVILAVISRSAWSCLNSLLYSTAGLNVSAFSVDFMRFFICHWLCNSSSMWKGVQLNKVYWVSMLKRVSIDATSRRVGRLIKVWGE